MELLLFFDGIRRGVNIIGSWNVSMPEYSLKMRAANVI